MHSRPQVRPGSLGAVNFPSVGTGEQTPDIPNLCLGGGGGEACESGKWMSEISWGGSNALLAGPSLEANPTTGAEKHLL